MNPPPFHTAVGFLAMAVAALALLPLGFVVWAAVHAGWQQVLELVVRPRIGELLRNTALLLLTAVPTCTALALALAWLTERTNLPGARWWSWLAAAPLAIPAFVHSYAWVSAIPSIGGLWGATLTSVLAYFPFIYLPVAASLRRLDPALEDVASALGYGPWAVFYKVVLPQLRLPLWGGALLVGLHLLAEYGLFVMVRYDTFTTAIVDQFQTTFNGAGAHMMAGVLVLCCLFLLLLEGSTRGQERYARLGSGSARVRTVHALGWWLLPALLLCAATSALSIGVPLWTLGRWLVAGGLDVWRWAELLPSVGQTLLWSLCGAVLTTVLALPVAWLTVRRPGLWRRWARWLEGCHYVVGALPGIVVALALVTVTVQTLRPLYQTAFTLVLAYAMLFLPRALVNLRAGLAQAPEELEQAARSLGRTPMQALWQITLRLAAPGVASSISMVFLACATELTATLLLSPTGTNTLATQFWALTSEIDYAAAAPYAVLMVLLSLPLTWLLYVESRRSAGV
ncbi:iron ABC transporter permease [Curvibacter sp. CHRR-16]|uniref:ABC transporter permease n=1 Tax=Curvibacter sp. CHRR-16 TaxID=2835872 RepID=UPI001BD990F5|nr:iron ABC transporter permease [Curvibacter sp. CHRR-16]MBT0570302.1 iron ABC transporter permease [Curvibacter sp. CHRR-16]